MGENLVLCVDRLITPESLQSLQGPVPLGSSKEDSCSLVSGPSSSVTIHIEKDERQSPPLVEEEEPLIQAVECRICQEEDSLKNLEVPCACSGSLKFAHRKCVQRWCDEKGDTICEICHQSYQPGYTAPPPPAFSDESSIDISGGWTIAGNPLDLHDPHLLSMSSAERHLLEAEFDDYDDANASGAAFCRSAALILMALLLLRHALTFGNGDRDEDDDASTFFSLFMLRAAGFLLPCYIMAWAISILQRRRQRQEAAALAATEVAFMLQRELQRGQHRGLQVTIAPRTATTPGQAGIPHREPPI